MATLKTTEDPNQVKNELFHLCELLCEDRERSDRRTVEEDFPPGSLSSPLAGYVNLFLLLSPQMRKATISLID
jgi:hypothetical protein